MAGNNCTCLLDQEQMYVLEIQVIRLNLNRDKTNDTAPFPINVFVDFLHLPRFEIKQTCSSPTNEPNTTCWSFCNFDVSRSCCFWKTPKNLANTVQSNPLRIEIYKKEKQDDDICSSEKFEHICHAEVPFVDCGCNEKDGFALKFTQPSKPFVIKNIYKLQNHQGNIVGSIQVRLQLYCFDQVDHFDKNANEDCTINNIFEEKCQEAKELDKENKCDSIYPPLEVPHPPPKVAFGQPGFDRLTNAEKLNDPTYREIIYRTYPNEPTCGCPSIQQSMPISARKANVCPSGCMSSSCFTLKQRDDYLQQTNVSGNVYCNSTRLYHSSNKTIYNTNQDCYEKREKCDHKNFTENRFPSLCPKDYGDNIESMNLTDIIKPCISLNDISSLKSESSYSRKNRLRKSTRQTSDQNTSCTKFICNEIGRLIGAMKDMQDYVDSIGKCPVLEPFYTKISPSEANSTLHNTFCYGNKDDKTDQEGLLEINITPKCLDNNKGPCGKFTCKSRRKKKPNDVGNTNLEFVENTLNDQKKADDVGKRKYKLDLQQKDKNKKYRIRNKRYSNRSPDRSVISKPQSSVSQKIGKFIYSAGDIYPGVQRGHKTCVERIPRIPANMGWLWNINENLGRLKPRIGWKPGAINSALHRMMREVKEEFLQEYAERPKSAPSRGRKDRAKKTRSLSVMKKQYHASRKEVTEEEYIEPPPTLRVLRKDGNYHVTMYPITRDTSKVPQLDIPTKPLQFKIAKNKGGGSSTSSSTASDMEIEFSPPAAVNRYRKKPDVVHVDTQVKQQEILDAFKSVDSKKKAEKPKKQKKK